LDGRNLDRWVPKPQEKQVQTGFKLRFHASTSLNLPDLNGTWNDLASSVMNRKLKMSCDYTILSHHQSS